MRNKRYLCCGILTAGLLLVPGVAAWGRDLELIDEGAAMGGVMSSGLGAFGADGDVVYRFQRGSGYFFRSLPGYRDYDDIQAESGGELVFYELDVFGSTVFGSQAGSPYDVRVRLYQDTNGDLSGVPQADMIPGTECVFTSLPAGLTFRVQCKPPSGIIIPDAFWLAVDFSTDNAGWLIADFDSDVNPDIGSSDDRFAEEDFINDPGQFTFLLFGGCGPNPCASMLARVVTTGRPWGCCEASTFDCVNVQETQCDPATSIFRVGTLCNDLDPPCSQSGACCNVATGVCTPSFKSLCQQFTEVFTPGGVCPTDGTNPAEVECEVPGEVPTMSHWSMMVLTILLLAGLTIKFGRQRSTAA